jgi:hypothetical protein
MRTISMNRLPLIAVLIGLGAAACGERPRPIPPEGGDPSARERAVAWLRTARFEDADPAIECQPDCGEQERGFDYARAGRIEQPGDCDLARVRSHASEDFIEGCRAYGQYLEAAGRGR